MCNINKYSLNFNLFIVGICTFIAYFLIFEHSLLFMLSDAYYYSSLAESLNQSGQLYSLTSFPKTPILTTQNGIVLFHYFLIKLGINDAIDRLYYLSSLCFLVIIAIIIFLKKIHIFILKRAETETYLVLLIIAFNTKFQISLLQPINDVFFIILAILYIYIFLNNTLSFSKKLIYYFLISIFIIHFRVQSIFVFLSAAIVCVYFKNYILSFIHLSLLAIAFSSVWLLNYFIVDNYSGLGNITEYFINSLSKDYLLNSFNTLINSTLPILFFGTKKLSQYYSFVFIVILLSVPLSAYKAILNKNRGMLFLSIFVFLNILFVVVFPSQNARYLLVILPFIIVLSLELISSGYYQRLILFTYLALLVLIFSYRVCIATHKTSLGEEVGIHFDIDYSLNKKNSKIFLQRYNYDYDLITETYQGRVTYFLFGKRNISNQKTKSENIIYAGTVKSYKYYRSKLLQDKVKIISEKNTNLSFNLSHHMRNDSTIILLKVAYPLD